MLWSVLWLVLAMGAAAQNRERIGDVFADPDLDLNDPASRALAVERIRAIEDAGRARAEARARALGIPMRREFPDGTVTEIVGLDENDAFLIYTTHNANAAISTAANRVHPAPYHLDGSGLIVGVWDSGAVRDTHTEFQTDEGSRVTIIDQVALSNHGTHVAGTIGARGASASRKGMAPNVRIDSYDWNNDTSQMTGRAASAPGQADRLPISNHSYGYIVGWSGSGSNWTWHGTGTDQNAYAAEFGQYTAKARNWDSLAYSAPYYLVFKAAGNDNNDNPAAGDEVIIGGSEVTYDPAIHPPGDGLYRNTTTDPAHGYENISSVGNAKNIVTVGSVNDAVDSDGERDPERAVLALLSSRGPTDDGRIKPDIVANGVTLSSTSSGGDGSYTTMSGTSMAAPNAAGSAALLVHLYRDLFPGGDMRASTLKGLLIHTATDLGEFGLGNPGPDYHYGWGLINVRKAADLIIDHHANPEKQRMIEDTVTTFNASRSYAFVWDGVSPIRATLSWTDPAGASTFAHDSRIPRLVNDLDLKVIAPDGTEYFPFVMPFVGTWTVESMSLPATTGVNSTDNVEQVRIHEPGQAGAWQAVVTYKGTLTNDAQVFSLLLSGSDSLTTIPPSMSVTRGGAAIVNGGVDGVSGTAAGMGTALAYTIANTGGGPLELIAPVSIGGEDNCSVTVNAQPAGTVPGGGDTSLELTVTPAAEGAWSFTVSIANNDEDENPYDWTVTGVAGVVASGEATFTAVADTYIDNHSPDTNFGTATTIRLNHQSGGQPAGRLHMRGLLRFDLASIPTTATIHSARLDFVQDNDRAVTFGVFEATGSWGETTATWSNGNGLFGSTSFGSATTGTSAGAAVPTITMNASGLAKVQDWVTTPSDNHGFGIVANEMGNTQNWLALRSREHATESHRPMLTVEYGGAVVPADLPLMVVTRDGQLVTDAGTDSVSGTEAGIVTELTYAIGNLGTVDLALTPPVDIPETSNCSVTVVTQPSGPVAPSGSTDLVLTVTPTGAGAWSATVSIGNSDPDRNPYAWTINGSAQGTYTVTFQTDGTPGASLTGETSQTIAHGGDASEVTANAPDSHVFVNWTLDDVEYSRDATVAPTNVTADMDLVANFAARTELTITANSSEKVYDGTALTEGGYGITAGSLKEGHTLVSVTVTGSRTAAGSSANVASAAVIQDTGDTDVTAEYAITYADGALTVTPATLTVTPDAGQSKVFGDSDPVLTFAHAGAVAGETPAFAGALSREEGENAGEYAIEQGTLAPADNAPFLAANYTLAFTADVPFTIEKAAPTVTEWPTASAIVLGQALSASTLSGGSAEPTGDFGFRDPDTEPSPGGTYAAAVTFTPEDATNYTTVEGAVDVEVRVTVAFEKNAEDAVDPVPASATVTVGEAYGALAETSRAGYVFAGWFTAAGGGTAVSSETVVTETGHHTLYAQWIAAYEGWSDGASFEEDASGDGIANGLAWALGAESPDDDVRELGLLPTLERIVSDGQVLLRFTYRRASVARDDPDTAIAAVYSTDLEYWTEADEEGEGINVIEEIDGFGPGVDRVEVDVSENLAEDGRLFIRLRVERTAP